MESEQSDHNFTEDEKKALNSVTQLPKGDAIFVRLVLEFLYKDN